MGEHAVFCSIEWRKYTHGKSSWGFKYQKFSPSSPPPSCSSLPSPLSSPTFFSLPSTVLSPSLSLFLLYLFPLLLLFLPLFYILFPSLLLFLTTPSFPFFFSPSPSPSFFPPVSSYSSSSSSLPGKHNK